jgi:hypothetical protein
MARPTLAEGPIAPCPAVELLRNLDVAAVVTALVARLELDNWTGAVLLGLALWIAFPVVLFAGSVLTRTCRGGSPHPRW